MRKNRDEEVELVYLRFTSQPGTIGPVFGANDYWTGMGLFLDSFDNDGQVC